MDLDFDVLFQYLYKREKNPLRGGIFEDKHIKDFEVHQGNIHPCTLNSEDMGLKF